MNKVKIKPRVLFLIQLPPPVHGVAEINQLIWQSRILDEWIDKRLVELDFANNLKSLRKFTLGKIRLLFSIRKRLIREMKDFNPDYVYFSLMPLGWGFLRDLLFIRAIRKAGIQTIYHLHNRGMQANLKNFIYRQLYHYALMGNKIIHLSAELLKDEILSGGIKPQASTVIGNGIKLVDYRFEKPEDGLFRILFVANLFPEKGLFLLPGILKQLLEAEERIQLRVVGGFMRTRYESSFLRNIQKHRINEKQIVLCGEKNGRDKWEEYFTADMFIFPSVFRQECFPLVILEAMQAGLPLVASSIGAIPEIITHGENGFLVQPGNIAGFVKYTLELQRDPYLRRRIGTEARKQFMAKHNSDMMESKIASFILS